MRSSKMKETNPLYIYEIGILLISSFFLEIKTFINYNILKNP